MLFRGRLSDHVYLTLSLFSLFWFLSVIFIQIKQTTKSYANNYTNRDRLKILSGFFFGLCVSLIATREWEEGRMKVSELEIIKQNTWIWMKSPACHRWSFQIIITNYYTLIPFERERKRIKSNSSLMTFIRSYIW